MACSAPRFQGQGLRDRHSLTDISLDTVFSAGYTGMRDVCASPFVKEKNTGIVKHNCTFGAHFPSYARSCHISSRAVTEMMRILKNDGVNYSGKYTVCVLLSAKDNRMISFRWKRSDGVQRVYYAYSKKGTGENFYNHRGISTVSRRPLTMPLEKSRISSPFGMRIHPIHKIYKHHKGVDFSAPKGTSVYASGSGKVIHAGSLAGYGKCVRIRHNGGYVTTYAHLDRYAKNLRKGCFVVMGDGIGWVGMTGSATAPHLHYEVRRGKSLLNPVLYTEKALRLSGKEKRTFERQIKLVEKHYTL